MTKEGKDTAFFQERREVASKEVKVQFINDIFEQFNVMDAENNIKYFGVITKDSLDNECSCPSFLYGMKYEKLDDESKRGESRYVAENGKPFACKHLIRTTSLRMLGVKNED